MPDKSLLRLAVAFPGSDNGNRRLLTWNHISAVRMSGTDDEIGQPFYDIKDALLMERHNSER